MLYHKLPRRLMNIAPASHKPCTGLDIVRVLMNFRAAICRSCSSRCARRRLYFCFPFPEPGFLHGSSQPCLFVNDRSTLSTRTSWKVSLVPLPHWQQASNERRTPRSSRLFRARCSQAEPRTRPDSPEVFGWRPPRHVAQGQPPAIEALRLLLLLPVPLPLLPLTMQPFPPLRRCRRALAETIEDLRPERESTD